MQCQVSWPGQYSNQIDTFRKMIFVDWRKWKILNLKEKAQGIIKQLEYIFEEMFFGNLFVEVASILRNSVFINGILTNLEASYGTIEHEI